MSFGNFGSSDSPFGRGPSPGSGFSPFGRKPSLSPNPNAFGALDDRDNGELNHQIETLNDQIRSLENSLSTAQGTLEKANLEKDRFAAELAGERTQHKALSRNHSALQNAKAETDEAYAILKESLSRIFDNAEYSDLKISCGSMVYEVHKAIICPRSTFFAAACRDSSGFKESQTGIIDLADDDPDSVQMMVHYLYHFNYPIADTSTSVPTMSPKLHAKVYALSDKYDMPQLRDLALRKFKDMIYADVHVDPLLDGVVEAYTSTIDTDRGIRDIAVGAIFDRPDLLDLPEFQEKIQTIPQLNMDLLMLYRKQQREQLDHLDAVEYSK